MTNEVCVKFNFASLDDELEKAKQLVQLLKEAKMIVDMLSSNSKT